MLKQSSLDFIQLTAERFGAARILLFGSCLRKSEDEAGDIDLAVYGLSYKNYELMANELLWAPELNSKNVDLIRAESFLPIMVIAEHEGVPIYERKTVHEYATEEVSM
jgi:predicted nucleotidyltransferase